MRRLLFILCLASVSTLGSGCGPECEYLATRCNGPIVEVCDPNGFWARAMNCDDIQDADGRSWRCCASVNIYGSSLGHTCVPGALCFQEDR
jgi:hypothetical protein